MLSAGSRASRSGLAEMSFEKCILDSHLYRDIKQICMNRVISKIAMCAQTIQIQISETKISEIFFKRTSRTMRAIAPHFFNCIFGGGE